MSTHAKLSPSASKRWMLCAGSVSLTDHLIREGLIEADTTSFHAEEGSAAHKLGEVCLEKAVNADHHMGQKIYGDFKVDDDMAEAVQVYLDFIYGCINAADNDFIETKMGIEIKCSLKPYRITGLDGGTSDTVLEHEDHCIHVIDYKHGKGVAVEIEDNPQLMQYGLGALIKSHKKTSKNLPNIVLTIVQPRAFHPDGVIRSVEMKGADLIKWGKDVLVPAAKATQADDAPLVPGDEQCRWCQAKGQCTALYEKTQELAIADFKEDNFLDPRIMTDEQMMVVMDHAGAIRSFILAVEQEAKNRLDNGSKDYSDRYKLVTSKTQRKMIETAADDLSLYIDEELLFERKMKGIGAIEKALKPDYSKAEITKIMEEVTTKADGVTVIAPVTDKRIAIEASAISDFDGLEDDDW